MPIKVEPHRDVLRFLRFDCDAADRKAFHEAFDKVLRSPIANSEVYSDPRISPHVIRVFRFGRNVAAFEFDPAYNDGQGRLRLIECRKLPPRSSEKRSRGS